MEKRRKKQPAIRPDLPYDAPVDPINAAEMMTRHGRIRSDVLGSYTGMTADGERPEQDADDL